MKPAGEPVTLKWWLKGEWVIRKVVFLFCICFMIKKVTVSAVKDWNLKGECFPQFRRRQTFFEGESLFRNRRYKNKFSSDWYHFCSVKVFERSIITCCICFADTVLMKSLLFESAPIVRFRKIKNASKLLLFMWLLVFSPWNSFGTFFLRM